MNMSKLKYFGLHVTFLLFLIQGRIFAWGNTWMGISLESAVNAAHWKAGPFKYYGAFLLSNAGHDSDIYLGTLANAVPDYLFSSGLDFHAFLPLKKKIVFDIIESPRYVFYLDTKRERAFNNTFYGQVHIVFDRFYFQAGGGAINAKQRLNTELNINVRMKENSINGLVLYQVSKETSLALQCRRLAYNFENLTSEEVDIRQSLNRTENYVDFKVYVQKTRSRFYLGGEYGSYAFTEPVASFKDSRSQGISAGVEFLPPLGGYKGETAGLRGSINIGYKRLNVLDPVMKDYSGLSGNTRVSLGIIKLTALHFFISLGPQFSVYSSRTYYLQTSYGAGLARSLTRNILFDYDFYYSRNIYSIQEVNGGDSSEQVADRYATHSFRLNLRLRKTLEITLLANLSRRKSQLTPRPVSGQNFIGFSFTYGVVSGESSMLAGSNSR
jgi:hypothetical protein